MNAGKMFRYWRDVLGAPIITKDGREMKMKDFWIEYYDQHPETIEELRKAYEHPKYPIDEYPDNSVPGDK